MEEAVLPALVLGCNTPHGIGVLSDWIEEHTGHAPDFAATGWSDGHANSPRGNGNGHGVSEWWPIGEIFEPNGFGDGDGYGDGIGDGGELDGFSDNSPGDGSGDGERYGCGGDGFGDGDGNGRGGQL